MWIALVRASLKLSIVGGERKGGHEGKTRWGSLHSETTKNGEVDLRS